MTDGAAWAMLAAIGAAAAFGTANVAEMRAARRAHSRDDLHPRLLLELMKDPLWLIGIATSVVGYGLQAVALYLAPVILVQPLIVTELLFALPLAAWLAHVRLGAREWMGIVVVAAGLALFMVAAHPSGDRTHAAGTTWLAMIVAIGAAVLTAVLVADRFRQRPMMRAAALSAGAGACFGLLSVDTKVVGHQFADDHLRALTHVQPWLLALTAIGGLLLAQTAFRIAPLSVSLPVIDIGEPLIASLLAIFAFGEGIGHARGALAGAISGAGIAAIGVVLLNSSPLIRNAQTGIQEGYEAASTA